MSVKIVYKEVAVGAAEGASIVPAGQSSLCNTSFLPFAFGAEYSRHATLEHNYWRLNGSKSIYISGDEPPYNWPIFGFWSQSLSGDNCYFDEVPEIDAYLDDYYTSRGITIDFVPGSFCSEVEVIWYDGGAVMFQKTFYPDAYSYFCENYVEKYTHIKIRLIQTSHPRQRAKVEGIYFGAKHVFHRDQLRSVRILQQIDLISKELPENVLDWRLNSANNVEYMFEVKQPVEAYDGDKLMGVFFLRQSQRRGPRLYDMNCGDAIGLLGDDPFPDTFYTDKSAYEAALEICWDYAVEMDEALMQKTVTGPLIGMTRRQALQQLCFAIGAVADTSNYRGIKIFAPPNTDPKEIPSNRTRVGGYVKKSDLVTGVCVVSHDYTAVDEGGDIQINGQSYTDTQTEHWLYNPDVSDRDKKNVKRIGDAALVSSAIAEEVLPRVYNFYMKRNTHYVKFRLDGENMGDYLTTPTNWGEVVTGNYTRATIVLSGIAVATAEVIGP